MGLSMWRSKAAAKLWVILLLTASPAGAQETWREYSYADDGFAISAAVPPLRETRKTTAAKNPVEVHSYSFFPPPPGTVFIVSVTALAAADKRTDEDVVKDFVKGKESEPVSQSGLQGAQVVSVQGEYNQVLRVFAKDHRLYQLSITAPSAQPPHPQAERWLESWRILAPQATQ
jgi:hypothetical protein